MWWTFTLSKKGDSHDEQNQGKKQMKATEKQKEEAQMEQRTFIFSDTNNSAYICGGGSPKRDHKAVVFECTIWEPHYEPT